MPIKLNPDKFKTRTGGSGPRHPGRKGKFKATLVSVEVPFKKGDESNLNVKTEVVLHNTVEGDDSLDRPVEGVRLIQYKPITGVYKSGDVKGESRMMEVAHLLTYTGGSFSKVIDTLNKTLADFDETKPDGVKGIQKALTTLFAKNAVGKPVGVSIGGLESKPYQGAYKVDHQIVDPASVEDAIRLNSAALPWTSGEIAKIEKSEGRSATADMVDAASNIEIPDGDGFETGGGADDDGAFDLPE